MAIDAPVAEAERLEAIDLLRGVAVLGILLVNMQWFAMPNAAAVNPHALGQPSLTDLTIWSAIELFAESKFITVFSLLFGAGVVLMTGRLEGRGVSSGRVHYRRMTWLLVFGLVHAYVLWHGDILVLYAICGRLIFYGHGLGLFGAVDRLQQLLLTIVIWIVLLILAPVWLRRFRYGPLEWLWRTLTYGHRVPMRRV